MTKASKKIVAILYGGRSGEHEVSLASAASVTRHLSSERYDVVLIGITQDGAWYLQDPAELASCRAGAAALSIREDDQKRIVVVPGGGKEAGLSLRGGGAVGVDVVIPVLHGTYGEDGTIQGLLEMAALPYAGSGVLGSAIGMDKDRAKVLWARAGLPVVPWLCLRPADWATQEGRDSSVERAATSFGYPLFVKPCSAGSSVGAAKAGNRAELERAVIEAFRWDDKVLVEPYIPAREIECSVTGNDESVAWTPGEIVPSHEFYDYEAKYMDPNGAALLVPAQIDEDTTERVKNLAVKAYREAELSGFARVDFFIRKDSGDLLINEVNTIPGFTSISMFPRMCDAGGLPYGELLDHVVALAEDRYQTKARRDYRRDGGGQR